MPKSNRTRRRSPSTIRQLRDLGLPADYPLSPHKGSYQFYKTHKGKRYYFGSMNDPAAALALYETEWEHIKAGKTIPTPVAPDEDETETVKSVIERWLKRQHVRMNNHKIAPNTYQDYVRVCQFMRDNLGDATKVENLRPLVWTDLRDAIDTMTTSPTVQTRFVTISKMPWKWAWEAEVIENAIRFGPDFKIAGKKEVRKKRHQTARRVFTAGEVREIIDAAPVHLRAMVYLGVNGGMTQAEVSGLQRSDLHLDEKVIRMVRNKTGVSRTIPLWDETVKALRASMRIKRQRKTPEGKGLVFITRHGLPYVRSIESATGVITNRDNVAREFRKTLVTCGVKVPAGLGFGKLRHTFRTAADPVRDVNAIRRVMGHEIGEGVEVHYIADIGLDRLRAVTDAVHAWLLDEKGGKAKKG